MRLLILLASILLLAGCNCYSSYNEAWAACNKKYNGQCRYLGKSYRVCEHKMGDCTGDAECRALYGDPYYPPRR